MRKPTILIFIGSNRLTFEELHDMYAFHYYPHSFNESPQEIVIKTLYDLEKKKIRPDAVIGVNDDTSILASLAASELGLIGPSPRSLLLAQHKGLFTPLARAANPAMPKTFILKSDETLPEGLPFPGFMKMVKSNVSSFAFMINSRQELKEKSELVWQSQHPIHRWFQSFFDSQKQTSEHLIPLDALIYQRFIDEEQYTVDGFIQQGEVTLLGITRSVYTPDRKSFLRFDFPATFPEGVTAKLHKIITKLMSLTGYDNSGFNIEFFLTKRGDIYIIELNTRISNQFVPLMKERYTRTNVEYILDVALGIKPTITLKKTARFATSFPLRTRTDQLVTFVPDRAYFADLERRLGVLSIRPLVASGTRLSSYPNDAYSYRYAFIDIAGDSMEEINEKYKAVMNHLGIVMQPV
jgi:hypothetical protein